MKKFGWSFILFYFTLCGIAQVPSYVPTNGLVGWWSFSGSAQDDSGNGNNGTVNGPSLTTDRWNCPNRAYLFNANNITLSNTSSVFSPNQFTISGWFNSTYSTSAYITVFSNFSTGSFGIAGYWIGLKGNKVCFYLANGSFIEIMSAENFNDGLWHMLTATYDGATGRLYADGQLKNSVAYNIVHPPTTTVYIGSDQQLEHFYGKIDDVGFWNQVLTPQEITNLYQLSSSSTSITPLSSTTFCPGGSVTLQANTGSNYTYEWYNNGVLISGANQSSYVANVSGTYTVSVSGSCATSTASSTVTVLAAGDPSCSAPSCSATASNSGPQCEGSTIQLNASGGGTYAWSGPNSFSSSAQNPTISNAPLAASGIYTVTIDVGGCTATASTTLVVNSSPIINAGASVSICNGSSTTLTASGGTSYTWSPSSGLSSTNTATVNASPSTGTTYIVTGTGASGCTATSSVLVTVNPLPVLSGNDASVCEGGTVNLNVSGALVYAWSPSVNLSASTGSNVVFTAGNTTTYTVTGANANNCTNTLLITVNVAPGITVNAGSDQIECFGTPITLSATGAFSYTWSGGVTNGQSFIPVVGSTIYTVTGTDAFGCTGTDDVLVVVESPPTVAFSSDVTTGCAPLTVTLKNTGSSGNECIWSIGSNTLTGCDSVVYTLENEGCVDVSLTVASVGGCVSTLSASDLICAEPQPIASFVPSSSQLTEMDAFVGFINETVNANTYFWDFGDGTTTSTDENPTHDYQGLETGAYLVTLIATSSSGCTDTSQRYITISEELIFYMPNSFTPNNDEYNQTFKPVFTSGFDPFDFNMKIFNRWGETVFESNDAAKGWDGSFTAYDNNTLAQDGLYTWKIEFKSNMNDDRKMIVGHVALLR